MHRARPVATLGAIFWTTESRHPFWRRFYPFVPALYAAARWLRAPMFCLAVGSQANIGGAVSTPVVAAAFHPTLAPVGVLLALLGFALGTYGGWLTGQLMRIVARQ